MASVMAIESEVIGECVEGIRVEVGRKMLGIVLLRLAVFAIRHSVPCWVCRQVALTVMVPGIGGWFTGLWV